MFDDEFIDYMGITQGHEDMPKSLRRKLNSHICYKGGGGTTVTESGLPKEFRPYVERALAQAEGMWNTEIGEGGKNVATAYDQLGTAGQRLGAEAAAERSALDQFKTEGAGSAAARGEYGRQLGQDWNQMIQDDLAKTGASGALGMSSSGTLGSARAGMAQQGALADRAMQLRQAENSARTGAAQGLSGLDAATQQRYLSGLEAGQALGQQEYQAAEAGVKSAMGKEDAPHRAMERFFGYLGSGALGESSTSTTSGGGK
jgi:hypothetical protein